MQKNEIEKFQDLSFITNNKNKLYDTSILKEILKQDSNHGVCGSLNLGNTCYMNSSIACLSNCIELTTFFLSKKFKDYKNSSNKFGLKGKLAQSWYELLKDYWKTNKESGNPSEIKALVGKKDKKFETDEQQDANEFIIIFLEILSEDLNEIKNKKYIALEEQKANETDIECAKRFWEVNISRNNSIITDLFCGLNKSKIRCPICKYKSITYNPFNSLSLLIPNNEQLKKIKYLNFSKDDIIIFYIPKFSFGITVKAYIRVNKNDSLKDILFNTVNQLEDFIYEIENVDFISVVNKTFIKMMKGDEQIRNVNQNEIFIFSIEKDFYKNKEMHFIPIYIKIGDKFASHPRGLYLYPGMPYKEFKKKIYIMARKYFYSMISERQYDIDKKMKKLVSNNYSKKDEETLIKLIEQEYDDLLKTKNLKEIIFPYKIIIQKNVCSKNNEIIFNGKEDNFELLNKYEINSYEKEVDLLSVDLTRLNNILIINIDNESKFYRKSIGQTLDLGMAIKSEDYCQKNYIEDGHITLEDCFQLFNIEEHLEKGNEWYCNRCKNHVNALKKLEFFYLPKIMCICLSRFEKNGNYYSKNRKFVDFPLHNLNMNKFMAIKDGNNYIYDLFSVSQHYGDRGGGHYTAICKNYDGNWYTYDDSRVFLSSERDVVTENAYVLFYRRKDW